MATATRSPQKRTLVLGRRNFTMVRNVLQSGRKYFCFRKVRMLWLVALSDTPTLKTAPWLECRFIRHVQSRPKHPENRCVTHAEGSQFVFGAMKRFGEDFGFMHINMVFSKTTTLNQRNRNRPSNESRGNAKRQESSSP